ncbi:MAG: cupredoxin domain-containing protein [Nocardioides sp.]
MSPSRGASSSSSSQSAVITIKDFAFSGPSSVAPGTKITVQNEDTTAHTVTADDSSGGFDVKIDPGASATFKAPSKAGSYPFHCTYHSNMHATLKVS